MRSKRAIAALIAALAVAAVLWGLRGPAVGRGRVASTGAPPASRPSLDDSAARPAPAREPTATPTAVAPTPARPELPPAALARTTADDYRRRARYPRWSQPLEAGVDPIARDREVTPVRMRGPNGADPTLEVFPEAGGFESPEPVVIHALLSVDGRPVRAREMRATVATEGGDMVALLDFHDDGQAGDARAGDGLYTALLVPPPQPIEALAISYLVTVSARTVGDDERVAATSFLYSTPHAHLTGNFRDAAVDGSLALEAEIDVALAGRFHLEGTLYNADGSRALAWSQAAAELGVGRHWMTLQYYGLVLHDAGVDGPYLLRWAALSTTTAMPNAMNRPLENGWTTGAYRASAFTDRPFGDPALLEAAERIERDTPGLQPLEAGR